MQQKIHMVIEDALAMLGIPPVDFSVERPADPARGDYATNVAMVAARILHEESAVVAERIVRELMREKPEEIERVERAGPGFVNIYLARRFFTETVHTALAVGDAWGKNTTLAGKRVMVEYTDPNPFKEFHIGHLMPNALGESLARLLMYAGAEVKRVTYQGDVGIHVARAVYGMRKLGFTADTPLSGADLGRAYAEGTKASEASPDVAADITKLNKTIYERTDPEINALYDKGKAVSLRHFDEVYEILGSAFDHNFFESETGPIGVRHVRAHPEIFEESDGAVIFRGEKYGLHTRVFINKAGLPTYEAKDIGLIEKKYEWWRFDLSLTVTGSEQEHYFAVMKRAAELIHPALAGKVRLVLNGMLLLPSGKMSSRTGTVIPALTLIGTIQEKVLERIAERTLEERERLARDIAVGALKYAILRSAAGKDIVFDLEQSISFEGDSGPYLQYTHARICSVLRKAVAEGVVPATKDAPQEVAPVERLLHAFPDVVARAQSEYEPHYVTTYLTLLASVFNSWYAHEQIVNTADTYSPYKVALAGAVAQTLKNGLWTLGITAPERM